MNRSFVSGMKKFLVILSFLMLLIVPLAHSTTVLKVRGSSTVFPIISRCAEAFNAEQGDIVVKVSGGGSDRGIEAVATGKADIGMSSRKIKDSEIGKYGDRFVKYPIAKDGIAIIVSEDVYRDVTGLTIEELKGIYAGEIKNWKEFRGPDRRIVVVGRSIGSGTRDLFMESRFGSRDEKAKGVIMGAEDNSEMRMIVEGSDAAIGYVGCGYVKLLSIERGPRVIAINGVIPREGTIESGSYPLIRRLYMYTWDGTSLEEKAFIDFVLSEEGQKIVEDSGFVRIRAKPSVRAAKCICYPFDLIRIATKICMGG